MLVINCCVCVPWAELDSVLVINRCVCVCACVQVYRPYRATSHDMCRFHAEDYIDFLQRLVLSL